MRVVIERLLKKPISSPRPPAAHSRRRRPLPCLLYTSRVLVALDVTENVVSEAEKLGCQLIVSHHPLMNVRWHQAEMQTLRPDRYLGRLLRRLVKADISVISMHTNLDIAPGGVNDALAEALRIEDPGPMPGDEMCIRDRY